VHASYRFVDGGGHVLRSFRLQGSSIRLARRSTAIDVGSAALIGLGSIAFIGGIGSKDNGGIALLGILGIATGGFFLGTNRNTVEQRDLPPKREEAIQVPVRATGASLMLRF
jgi:hypothetical protein